MKKTLSIILAVFIMAIMAPMVFAADDTVTLDLSKGNIKITETGYSINNGIETAFTGDYTITGKNDEAKAGNAIQIDSVAEGSDITLKDVEISQKGPICLQLNTDVTLNAEGTVKLSSKSPAINATGKNIVIKGDADFVISTNSPLDFATMDWTCKSIDLEGTSDSPLIYGCNDLKLNAENDVEINGWIGTNKAEIVAGGNITVSDTKSTTPVFSGASTLKSTGGDVTIDYKGMISSGSAFTVEAAGDVTINSEYSSPLISGSATTITGNNVTFVNTGTGMLASSSAPFNINATGYISLECTSDSPAISAKGIALKGTDVTFVNSGKGMLVSDSGSFNIEATGDVYLECTAGSPTIAANGITLKGADVTLINNGTNMLISTSSDVSIDATGDISFECTTSSPAVSGNEIVLKGDNVTLVNNGTGLLISGSSGFNVEAEGDITLQSSTIGPPMISSKGVGLTGNNVKLINNSGYLISSPSFDVNIDAKGNITFEGNTSGASLVSANEINLSGADVTLNNSGTATLISTSSALNIEATGDIYFEGKSSAPLVSAKGIGLTGDNVTLVNNGTGILISEGDSGLSIEAEGDITLQSSTKGAPMISARGIDLTGDNVRLSNDSGCLISVSPNSVNIDAEGNIDFEGNTSSAPLVSVTEINLKGNDITFTNDAIGMIVYGNTMTVDAAGKFTAVGASNSFIISANDDTKEIDITAKEVEIENTQTNGMVIAGRCAITATNGDISIKGNLSNPGVVTGNFTATAENGTVTVQNDGSGFVTGGSKLDITAKNIVLSNPNATNPVNPYGFTLTAEEDITVVTGYSAPTYNPTGETENYDFGNKLTITTSEGTTEHTHEYVDVQYNNDATCTADGTKLVKCDCDWAKEKTVVATGSMLDHADEDGDYICDYGCGSEVPCENCGVIHETMLEEYICIVIRLIKVIVSVINYIF